MANSNCGQRTLNGSICEPGLPYISLTEHHICFQGNNPPNLFSAAKPSQSLYYTIDTTVLKDGNAL